MISGDIMPPDEKFDFNLEKQRAAERLRELNARSKYPNNFTAPPCNVKSRGNKTDKRPEHPDFLPGLKIPFLGDLALDSDLALILGLVLILTTEKADKLLLLALLYILI